MNKRYNLTVRIEVTELSASYSGAGITVTVERTIEADGFFDLARLADPIVTMAENTGTARADRK